MSNKRTAKIVSIMLAILMVFGGMFSPVSEIGVSKVYAAEHTVSTWGELESTIAGANPGDVIEITDNLIADHAIVVDKEIKITGGASGPFTVYQKQRDTYDSMFIVDGGNLTLGENLTLSGEVIECTDNSKTLDDFAVTLDREEPGDATPATIEESDGTGTFTFSEGNLGISGMYVLKNDSTYPFTIAGGYLKVNVSGTDYFVDSESNGNYIMHTSLNANKALSVRDASQSMVTPNDGDEVYIYDPNFGGFLGWDGNYLVSQNGTEPFNATNAVKFTYHANKTTYYVVPGTTEPKYTDINDSALQAAMVTYNENHPKTVQKPGWKIDGVEFVNPDDQTAAEAALAAYNAVHGQTCDTTAPKCPNSVGSDGAYNRNSFNGDIDAYNPKGFFVHVTSGKATLDGATLTNFITNRNKDKSPQFVAPVVASGTGASFDVKSGAIRNNIVGYIVDDSKANESADTIKMYIKGAAPNAIRKPGSTRRNRQAGIDNGNPGSGITATSGGIIYAEGAAGDITGGSIQFNRGDTGGIMATGTNTKVTLAAGTNVNNNVGAQFGGGVTTEDDALIVMTGGTLKENVAWFGGGAVFATENGVRWLRGKITNKDDRKDGKFVMEGGTIEGNTAFTRGGGFLVDSDGVSLIKGIIKNNMSRMLGGGMYVMGDHPDFTYTVYINKGYVHENKAVSSGSKDRGYVATDADNQILSRKLVAPNGCTGVPKLFDGQMGKNSDDMVDGYPWGSDGTGGGVWLCAYGNTVLNVDGDKFIVDNNYASGSVTQGKATKPNQVQEGISSAKAGGNDIHKETKGPGNIVIFGINDDSIKWYDENNGEHYTSLANAKNGSITDFSLKNLTNVGSHTPAGYTPGTYDGVDIFGNISRRGGGLAANGTFIFGEAEAMGEAYSELAVTKTWTGGVTPEDVTIRINLEYEEGGEKKTIKVIELPLTEVVSTEEAGSELDTVFPDGSTTDANGNTVYLGHIVLPITVEDENGNQIQLFDLLSDTNKTIEGGDTVQAGETFEMNTAKGLIRLGRYIKGGGTVTLSNAERKLTFVELKDDGSGNLVEVEGYELTPSEMKLSTSPAPTFHEETVFQVQTDGSEKPVGTIITSDVRFEAALYNDKPSEIDKYVNKAVHKDIDLEEEFEYDIIAYVKHGTDKIIIEDQLVEDLEFVSNVSDVQVVSLDENNHLPKNNIAGEMINDTASVAEAGTPIDNKKVDIEGNKLTVSIENKLEEVKDVNGNIIGYKNAADGQDLKALWGKWVKVTYKAQIKKEYQDKIKAGTMSLSDLKSVTVKGGEKYKAEPSIFDDDDTVTERPEPNVGNAPVESNETHSGIDNTASYSLEVKNEPAFRDESNTVTVKPQEPEVEKYVSNAVHKEIELGEEFEYEIIGFITKDADKVIFEDELVPDLEFTDDPNVKVSYLDTNNHLPQNDIYGIEVNENATVAKEGTDITEEAGVTISTENGKLTVTIDDKVKVNEGTGAVTREIEIVKNLRGKYVKVTFNARIKKSIQEEIANGKKTISDLANVTVKAAENKPVLSDEAHNGIDNQAKMTIEVGNKGKYNLESNVVTVKPEQPEIEKYVAKAVHKDIALDEVFEYDIIAYVTKSADSFVITDTLVDDLELVGDVTVTDLGTSDNHKVVNDVSGNAVSGNEDATVAKEGTDITDQATITIEGNEIVVSMDDVVSESEGTLVREKEDVLKLRGHWVRVSFSAQIKADLQQKINDGELTVYDLKSVKVTAADVYKPDGTIYKDGDRPLENVGNAPVISDEDHEGIENTASYVVSVFNEGKYKEASDESNTVTVKPKQPVVPEVAKFDIPVEKNWDEYMNDSSRRPTSITVHLLADGVKLEGKSMTLTEADEWKGIYRDLPRTDKEGNEIKYTLEEEAVDYYYPETVWTDMTYKVINHTRPWIPRLPSTPGNVGYVRVTKTVSGIADKDADYEITVKFTYPNDGGEYTHTLLLNPTSNPTFFFDYIPTGTVVEISEKEGDYTMTCTADKKVTTTFTVEVGKTHEVEINNDKPETPETPTKTGDGANLLQWLLLIALTAITALLAAYRRKLGQEARK